jgi:hypothetical protein
MSVYNRTMKAYRYYGALGLSAVLILVGSSYAMRSPDSRLAVVTGQVTCGNHPTGEMMVYFEPLEKGCLSAVGRVHPDGSFHHLYNCNDRLYEGVMPGRYRVFFRPDGSDEVGSPIDKKYLDLQTSDLVVDVRSDWNYVCFDLH